MRRLDSAVALLVFLLLPASVWAARAGGIVFWLLALVGLLVMVAVRLGAPAGRLARSESQWRALRWLWAASVLPLALNCASVLWFRLPMREIAFWPFLAMPLIAAAVARVDDAAGRYVRGALLACWVAAAAAAWSRFVLHEEQPTFMMNPLPYGNIAFASMLCAVWAVAYRPRRGLGRFLAAAAVLMGAAAYVASGIRGGLLAVPLALLAFLHLGDPRSVRDRVPWLRALAVVAIVGIALAVFQPRNALFSKLERVQVEVDDYLGGRTGYTNVGERLAMWRASVALFERNPLFGIGTHQFARATTELRTEGLYPQDAHIYRHAHSTYVTLLVEYGLIGCAVMLATVYCLWRALRLADPRYRQLGLLLVGSWLLFGVTNEILAHQTIIRCLVGTIAIFVATCSRPVEPPAPSSSPTGP